MNLTTFPILSLLIVVPLFGVFALLLARGEGYVLERNLRQFALWVSTIEVLLACLLLLNFDMEQASFQFKEHLEWNAPFSWNYSLAVDGISLPIILLTAFIMPLCFLFNFFVKKDMRLYVILFLLLESFVMGALTATDIILFYIFFEASLIPLFFIIGIWGGEQRFYAAFKFFLYTLSGSLLMLIAILFMIGEAQTSNIEELTQYPFDISMQKWLWLAFFASFAIKTPMIPFHSWLPSAHVEAPAGGSVVLAAVLLKLGAYGFMRFSLPIFPEASLFFAPFVLALSIIAIIYASMLAFVQNDMKKVIAYSSVAHMGYVTLGIFSGTIYGMQGAMVQIISHGFISAALFFLVGMIYERCHRREISFYGGIASVMPRFASFFMAFILASIALPGTSGFVGEFLILLGAWQVHPIWAVLAASGIILAPLYMLSLYRRIAFGTLKKHLRELNDLTMREMVILVPLLIVVMALGLYPAPWMALSEASLTSLMGSVP